MGRSLAGKILQQHLVDGDLAPGREVALRPDHVLLQDATGTLAWLAFEAIGIDRVRAPLVVQYVDHNLLQTGFENADDHLYLESVCAKYGATYSRAGNGISHFAHLERYARPGVLIVGCDSHTCQAGAMGMLGIGAGGAEVAAAMAGLPFHVKVPRVLRVQLRGRLGPWVSAKDVILEVLRRIGVKGGLGRVLEYTGDGVETLGVYERSTIANMGQETGATGTVFPSDEHTRRFLRSQGREEDFAPLQADPDAEYDEELEIDLAAVEPLVAQPWSPGNVVPVSELEGMEVRQVAIGSSVNSSFRDLMIVARVLQGRHIAPGLHVTLSPGSRQIFLNLLRAGVFLDVIQSGVRALEVACGPCIGMGAAPPTGGASVRTFNRNFKGRSGTEDDRVYLVSPETAAATALAGVLTDPRALGRMPRIEEPRRYVPYTAGFVGPPGDGSGVEIVRGPNIVGLPEVPGLPERLRGTTLLRLGDDVSTDDILPAGNQILPLRSNLPRIAEYTYRYVDGTFPGRARKAGVGLVIAGENFGQGSSREHAAAVQMYLGVRAILAKSFARIHESNLVNFCVAPLRFADPSDADRIRQGDELAIDDLREGLEQGVPIRARNLTRDFEFQLTHALSDRQVRMLLAGGLVRWIRDALRPDEGPVVKAFSDSHSPGMSQTTETVPPGRQGNPTESIHQVVDHIFELPFKAQLGVLHTIAPKILACMEEDARDGFLRKLDEEIRRASAGEPTYDARPEIPGIH